MSQTALITGANKGLGLETARQLARDHAFTVLLGCRDEARGAEAEVLLQNEGLDAHFLFLDVTSEASIQAAAATVQSSYGALDVLINNAGIMLEHDSQVGGVSLDTWRTLSTSTSSAP